MLGAGQLGKMSILAGRHMGYNFVTWDPDQAAPAAPISNRHFVERWDDLQHAAEFAGCCDVVTCEFENVPAALLDKIAETCPVRPAAKVFSICQNREREKTFLAENNFPCAAFAVVNSAEETEDAVKKLGSPCILKSAQWGYDGKGQSSIDRKDDPAEVWRESGLERGIVEKRIDFEAELSVICARRPSGEMLCFPAAENRHARHILDVTIAPGRFESRVILDATRLALGLAEQMQVEGLLAVEMFLTREGELLVNEMAPRPHNSGHYTIEACATSQFQQHIRAVCDQPLGTPALLRPAVMINLLGDLWTGGEPDWTAVLEAPGAFLHLYGKTEPRPGRKMGHFTVIDDDPALALQRAEEIRARLADLAPQGG